MNRTSITVVGESGSGLLSVGKIIAETVKNLGYFLVADREFPSLIKGGESAFALNFSDEEIFGLERKTDVFVSMGKKPAKKFFSRIKDGGIWIHGYERLFGMKDLYAEAEKRNIKIVHLNIREITKEVGGISLMQNVVLIGMVWKTLGFDFELIQEEIKKNFAKKPQFLEANLKCLQAGFERVDNFAKNLDIPVSKNKNPNNAILEGNEAISLGAIAAGVRCFFAYPMSPASTILTHMANFAKKFGITLKQVEDEISVANMTIGASFAGTRAMCATSGGGFDLMTETVSLAGIIEVPFVCVIVQRPGPATGLPTWTGQGDLNLAIYSGHGEYGKIVLAVSDPENAFALTQHAHNLAEKYQVPVIILSEKVIAEDFVTVPRDNFREIPIERGLANSNEVESKDRFAITESGVSKRWVPCSSEDAYYFSNGDEHDEMGRILEDEKAGDMYAKRVRKLDTIKKDLPEPILVGEEKADISFVGWGSSKSIMRDIIKIFAKKGIKVNYFHYEYLFPLKTEEFKKFREKNPNIHLIEGNMTGQLGRLLATESDESSEKLFRGKFLKWDGRPFFVEEVLEYVEGNLK